MIAEKSVGLTPQNTVRGKDFVWLNARNAPFKIYGVTYNAELSRFERMPQDFANSINDGIKMLNTNTSGGRVKFCTNAKKIAISVNQKNNVLLPHMPLCSMSGFDIYKDKTYIGTFMPKMNIKTGYAAEIALCGDFAEYTINFPLYDNVYELFIGFNEGATVDYAKEYKTKKPIVFYGSSITQGASCSHPGNCYASRLCRELDCDYINLGFAANCRGEKEIAEYIKKLDMSAFVMDFDHNCKDETELSAAHKPFFDIIREENPELPIVIMSAPDIITKPEFSKRCEVVENTYIKAKQNGDNNVYFINGETLFAGDSFDSCTVDGTHPNDFGFYRISKQLEKVLKNIIKD